MFVVEHDREDRGTAEGYVKTELADFFCEDLGVVEEAFAVGRVGIEQVENRDGCFADRGSNGVGEEVRTGTLTEQEIGRASCRERV